MRDFFYPFLQIICNFLDNIIRDIYIKLRMTKKRLQLLDILNNSRAPLNAAQIHALLSNPADLATVYRGLQYLEDNNFLTSFIFDCNERGTERYYTIKETQHMHYMHCEKCHQFTPFTACPFEGSIDDIESQYGFKIENHNITIKGRCSSCR